jgi:molybdenum cofactor cytidylyltransferase
MSVIEAILLAAGFGSRFGGDKLVARLADGTPIAAASVRNLRAVLPKVTAVVKPGDTALAALLDAEGCTVTVCEQAHRGMGASLAHGVAQTRGAAGWVIALADMPSISSATIAAVVHELADGAAIVAPAYHGERGHPVGFAGRFGQELIALDGDSGARAILRAHAADLTTVDCEDPGILYDIDRPADIT